MVIKKRYHKNLFNIAFSTLFTLGFSYFIIAADKYNIEENRGVVNAAFLQSQEQQTNGYIPLNDIIISDDYSDKFIYIVQPGDSLSSIAYNFGVTVENIKKVNNLKKGKIKPGDKLVISEEEGFIYNLEEKISLNDFAKKYKLDIQELKDINYISEGDSILEKGDELFLPISVDTAKKLGIIKTQEVEKPKIQEKIVQEKNDTKITKDKYEKPKTTNSKTLAKKEDIKKETKKLQYNGVSIVSKYYYRPSINNGFYAGFCTRYVAIKKFPYLSQSKQSRIWGGNAKDWYYNAKSAGYSVGSTPRSNSIVVLRYGGNRYYGYGHVGIVQEVDLNNKKILIEDMNAYGKFVVTKRWIPMDNKIIGYIY